MTVRHLILDRDGVLNVESADGWVTRIEDWRWELGARAGLAAIAAADLTVSIVTNQSCIGRGLATEADVDRLHRWLAAELQDLGVRVVGIFVCPHAPDDGCDCRKPAPGLILAAVDASGIPAPDTVLIGDDDRDLEAATAAGVAGVRVATGKGGDTPSAFPHLTAAVDAALAR